MYQFYVDTVRKFAILCFLASTPFLLSAQTYYVGPWNPIQHAPVVGSPGWEIQDDAVTGLTAADPFASWSQYVNLVDAISGTPSTNLTVFLDSDAYIESYDYNNDATNDNGLLGHNLGVTLHVESSGNGMTIEGSTDACYTVLDNTANGTGNLFASLEGVDGFTMRGVYLLNTYKGAFDIVNSTNILIEDCVFDNNDIGGVPVFRITSSNGTPMQITFRRCAFINNNNNTAKFDITREATGTMMDLDFEDCVWSCNSATNTAGTAIRVRNNASGPATDMMFTGCTFANNASGGSQGGAIYFEGTSSTTVFTNCNFIENSVTGGNGGGAIFIGANENVTIDGCAFYGNVSTSTSADGGAINVAPTSLSSIATLNITNTTFDNNTSGDDGGAINLRYVNATLNNIHIVNNNAGDGVIALGNASACLDITNYSCSGNSAPDGCIYNRGPSSCYTDNGGAATGAPVDLSGIAPDYACGAFCAITIPGTCLASTRGDGICAAPGAGTICGTTFLDDDDGIKEIGTDDSPINNSYILLYDQNGDLIGRTFSDPSGNYCFNNVPDGSYYVAFAPPETTPDAVIQNAGSDGALDSDIDGVNLASHIIVVDNSNPATISDDSAGGAQNHNNVDAGFGNPPPAEIDLEFVKTVNMSAPDIGDNVVFTLTVTNNGTIDALANVIVTDMLPSGLMYISDTGALGEYVSTSGIWTIPNVIAAAGGTATIMITAEVLATGDYVNVAEITSANGQTDPDSIFGNGTDTNPGSGVGSADPDGTQDPLDEDDEDDAVVTPATPCGPNNGNLTIIKG